MTQQTHKTTVAGVALALPVFDTPENTEELAQRVTERMREIEAGSHKIDTQAFALTAAVSFAAELAVARKDHEREMADVIKALSAILVRLDELLEASVPADS